MHVCAKVHQLANFRHFCSDYTVYFQLITNGAAIAIKEDRSRRHNLGRTDNS
jgi:hypothetical protein